MHIITFQTNPSRFFHKVLTIWEAVRWNFISSLNSSWYFGFFFSVTSCLFCADMFPLGRSNLLRLFHYLWHGMCSFSEESHDTILKEIQFKRHVNFFNSSGCSTDEKYHKWAWLCNFRSMGFLWGRKHYKFLPSQSLFFGGFEFLLHIWYSVKVKNKIKIWPVKNWCSELSWVEKRNCPEAEQLE